MSRTAWWKRRARDYWPSLLGCFILATAAWAATPTTPVSVTNVPLFTAGNPGVVSGTVTATDAATATAAAPSYVEGTSSPFSQNLTGDLRTIAKLAAGTAVVGKVGIDQTTPGTTNLVALAANQSVNAAQINGVTPLMGNGATGTGALRVSIANDNTGIVALPAAGTSVVGTKAAGTAGATSALVGGVFNSTVPALTDGQQAAAQSNTAGSRYVDTEGRKATYSASNATLTATAALATDVFILPGSASKTIRVRRVRLSGTATAAAAVAINLLVRSTANTGGTSTAIAKASHDSTNAAASAVPLAYSANPTTGTAVGSVGFGILTFTTTAGAIPMVPIEWKFGATGEQSIVLRGVAEGLAVNLGAVTVTGGNLYVEIDWTEE